MRIGDDVMRIHEAASVAKLLKENNGFFELMKTMGDFINVSPRLYNTAKIQQSTIRPSSYSDFRRILWMRCVPVYLIPVMAATTFSAQSEDTTIGTTRNHHVPQSPDNILSPRQAIFAFIVPLLLNFLQIKYQGKDVSPFETHPKTLVVAVSSLFITCVSFDARFRISADLRSSPNYYTFYYFAHSIMVIFGLLSLTSLVSILVPEPICPLLFLLAILFAICQLPLSQMIRMLKWLVAHIINTFNYQPQTNTATTTTGVMGLVSDDHINVAVPI